MAKELVFQVPIESWTIYGTANYNVATASIIDEETFNWIITEQPTLTINFGGVDYTVTPTLHTYDLYYGASDQSFTEYPFQLIVSAYMPYDVQSLHVGTTVPNAVPMTVKAYYGTDDPSGGCDWNEVTLTPPDEPTCNPCEEIADLDDRVTALEQGGGSISSTSVTIQSTDWSSNTATVTVQGVTSSNTVIVSPAPSDADAYADAGIICTAQGTNTLTFTCDSAPSGSITVNVVII